MDHKPQDRRPPIILYLTWVILIGAAVIGFMTDAFSVTFVAVGTLLLSLVPMWLGEKIGVSEGAIRHYETDFRTPKQPQIEAIAEALDISPLALKDFGVENARDLLGLLLQLENEFGIVPAEDGSSLSIDASAEKAPKATQMLKAWAAKRNELESGEITPEEYADWKAKF